MLVIGNLIILNNNLSFFAPYVLIAHFEFVAPFLKFVPFDFVICICRFDKAEFGGLLSPNRKKIVLQLVGFLKICSF